MPRIQDSGALLSLDLWLWNLLGGLVSQVIAETPLTGASGTSLMTRRHASLWVMRMLFATALSRSSESFQQVSMGRCILVADDLLLVRSVDSKNHNSYNSMSVKTATTPITPSSWNIRARGKGPNLIGRAVHHFFLLLQNLLFLDDLRVPLGLLPSHHVLSKSSNKFTNYMW